MKIKQVIPVIAGAGLIAGATIVVCTKIRRLQQLVYLKDETINGLDEMNQSLQEDLEEIEDDLQMLEEHEVFIDYLKAIIHKHKKTIENQEGQIAQLKDRLKHYDGAVVARVIRKKTNENIPSVTKVLMSGIFAHGSTSETWHLQNVVETCIVDVPDDTKFARNDWREQLKLMAKEKGLEIDVSVLEDVHSALIFIKEKNLVPKLKNLVILDVNCEAFGLPDGSAVLAYANGDLCLAIWEQSADEQVVPEE